MSKNPLIRLHKYGQSIWLDFIRRDMLVSGELIRMIKEDGLRGMTSNPSIFEKAIDGSADYLPVIRALAREGRDTAAIYETVAVEDVRMAADQFRPVYDESGGGDGFVSLEVSPHLAHDTEATIREARHLWSRVDRPNLMIKVPGTLEGLPAIRRLIADGLNINVTLLFGLERYQAVADAYISGLEDRVQAGLSVDGIASVASFFLSRIDVLVDPRLEEFMNGGGSRGEAARSVHGQVAIASARVAYRLYRDIVTSDRFQALKDKGARPQRLLWASTSTKNPAYSDVKYVEALIGAETVNTIPMETLIAYRDHGEPAARLTEGVDEAQRLLRRLSELDIDLGQVTRRLEDEGVEKFNQPFDRLMKSIEDKRVKALDEPVDPVVFQLGAHADDVAVRLQRLQQDQVAKRLWEKDPTVWKDDPTSGRVIRNALGWLHVARNMVGEVPRLRQFALDLKAEGFRHVVHMGMGGSSLAPLVFQRGFTPGTDGLPLTVLDTTDPVTIRRIEREIPLEHTLFVVASKSGTTAEPLAFADYFYDRLTSLKKHRAGENFVAITDPGTPLTELAGERKFRQVFVNFEDIGGRYSALSFFGMVPAALMGLDVGEILERALRMVEASDVSVPVSDNPGVRLGGTLGELARQGRDKLTFLTKGPLSTFGMWLEQLVAESTGKEGTGILPVAGETVGPPEVYGSDRVFIALSLAAQPDISFDEAVDRLGNAGHPVIRIRLTDMLDLGQEMMRWELATAVAGAVIGINAFDQPNVQESKDNTNRLLKQVADRGELPRQKPAGRWESLTLFASGSGGPVSLLKEFFNQVKSGDYIALQGYLPEEDRTVKALEEIRHLLRDRLHTAVTLGFGPRFLHSTGQYHKGGPNTGLFIMFTAEAAEDMKIPGHAYTFGVMRQAQALGDLEALRKHNRRVIRLDLGTDVLDGLLNVKTLFGNVLD